MPSISTINQELVRAFNINLCYNNVAITNLTVQNLHGKDHIVISFDKSTTQRQRMKYLSTLKEKVVKIFYKDERAAGISYNLQSFPFNFNKGRLEKDDKGKRFLVEIDEDIIFNLKVYLAHALEKDIKENMGKKFGIKYCMNNALAVSFNKDHYLRGTHFYNRELKEYFIDSFSEDIEGYGNAPSNYLKVDGNCVFIKKSIFDNVEFIKDIAAYNASLICRDFEVPIKQDRRLEHLKFPIIDFIRKVGIPVDFIFYTSYSGNDENSVLIPIINENGKGNRLFNNDDVNKVNNAFGMEILNDVSKSISDKLVKYGNYDNTVYGMDFSDLNISCCVMSKVIESSVINAKHELVIDPDLLRLLLQQNTLLRFFSHLSIQDEKQLEQILLTISSSEQIEKQYSNFSSFNERKQLYLKLHVSSEQIKQMELVWQSLPWYEPLRLQGVTVYYPGEPLKEDRLPNDSTSALGLSAIVVKSVALPCIDVPSNNSSGYGSVSSSSSVPTTSYIAGPSGKCHTSSNTTSSSSEYLDSEPNSEIDSVETEQFSRGVGTRSSGCFSASNYAEKMKV